MQTIDNNLLHDITGGARTTTTATTATNTALTNDTTLGRPALHLLKKLGHELHDLSNQNNTSQQTMMMFAVAMLASRR